MKTVKHRTGGISLTLTPIEAEYLFNSVRKGRPLAAELAGKLASIDIDVDALNNTCRNFMRECETQNILVYKK